MHPLHLVNPGEARHQLSVPVERILGVADLQQSGNKSRTPATGALLLPRCIIDSGFLLLAFSALLPRRKQFGQITPSAAVQDDCCFPWAQCRHCACGECAFRRPRSQNCVHQLGVRTFPQRDHAILRAGERFAELLRIKVHEDQPRRVALNRSQWAVAECALEVHCAAFIRDELECTVQFASPCTCANACARSLPGR